MRCILPAILTSKLVVTRGLRVPRMTSTIQSLRLLTYAESASQGLFAVGYFLRIQLYGFNMKNYLKNLNALWKRFLHWHGFIRPRPGRAEWTGGDNFIAYCDYCDKKILWSSQGWFHV